MTLGKHLRGQTHTVLADRYQRSWACDYLALFVLRAAAERTGDRPLERNVCFACSFDQTRDARQVCLWWRLRHLVTVATALRGTLELNVILVGWQRPIAGAGSVGGG